MEDVAAADAEALLQLLGPEREPLLDVVGQRRAHLGKAGYGGVRRRLGVGVRRKALAEQGEHVLAGRRQRRVGGGLAGGLDPRLRRRAARRARRARRRSGPPSSSRCRSSPRHGSSPGQDGKSGRPSSRHMTLTTGPAWRQPSGGSHPGQPRRGQRVGRGDHGAARRARRGSPPAPPVRIVAPAASAALRSALRHRAHPSASEAPGPRHPRGLAEIVVQRDEGGAGVLGARQAADQALERERARAPARRGCRSARRRSRLRAAPGRSLPASARGRPARASAAGPGPPPALAAPPTRGRPARPRSTSPSPVARPSCWRPTRSRPPGRPGTARPGRARGPRTCSPCRASSSSSMISLRSSDSV